MSVDLFTPLKIGSLELANRVVMAPLTRCRAGTSRVPNDYMRQYYEERASAGLIISEATAISEQGYGWYGAPGLYTEEHSRAWKPIVDAVHAKGGKMFLQLWHMGRASHSSFHSTREIVSASAIAISEGYIYDSKHEKSSYEVPRALDESEIPGVVQDYKKSAQLAKDAGFDGVEVHGANGYLIDQFLQSVSNKRTDGYGGSRENRYRLLKEVVEAVGQVYAYDRIGVRISPNGSYNGMGSDDNDEMFLYVASELSRYGLAYLHAMDGFRNDFHNKCSALTLYEIKRAFKGAVMGNVGYDKGTANGVLRSGSGDLISFGRLFISNPDLVERFKNDWPLNPLAPSKVWYGDKTDPKDMLEGYLGFSKYQE
mmetsp:Transcript_22986/g.25166  ORF Transcript_22986/g.25166 Transcript_22986/m.25166 type:complete len:369 (-) Transcript_22986:184-1290(-)